MVNGAVGSGLVKISRLLVRSHMLHGYDATSQLLTYPLTSNSDMFQPLTEVF